MKNKYKVTVVIPVFNGEKYIEQAILSVLNQTYKNIEIIVVNDGSTDNTETILTNMQQKYNFKYIYKKNSGCASALNEGIKHMSGEYFCWLSHDDIYEVEKIEKEIKVIQKLKNKNTIIFSNVKFINEKEKTINITNFENKLHIEGKSIYPVLLGTVNGCSVLINKKCFNETGLFDETKKTTHDYDMWFKLFKKFPYYFIEDSLIKYRIHENQDTNINENYIFESDNLWCEILNGIDIEEFKKYDNDNFNLLWDLKKRFYESCFIKSYRYVKKLIDKEENKSLKKKILEIIFTKLNPIKITVIIPVFNSQKYLNRCLFTVINALPINSEIIIINDGSTDNSDRIIKRYLKSFKNIKYYNITHHGIGYCRNFGVEKATGKYILFVDSDDEINENYFKDCYRFILEGYDMIIYDFLSKTSDNSFVTRAKNEKYLELSDKEGILYTSIMPSLCNKIIKRKIITESKYKFPENIKFEDFTTTLFFILKSKKLKYIKCGYYIYNIHNNSIMRSDNFNDMIDAISLLYNRLNQEKSNINNYEMLIFNTFYWRVEKEIFNKLYKYNIEERNQKIEYMYKNLENFFKEYTSNKFYIEKVEKYENNLKKYVKERDKAFITKNLENFIKTKKVIKISDEILY